MRSFWFSRLALCSQKIQLQTCWEHLQNSWLRLAAAVQMGVKCLHVTAPRLHCNLRYATDVHFRGHTAAARTGGTCEGNEPKSALRHLGCQRSVKRKQHVRVTLLAHDASCDGAPGDPPIGKQR